MYFDRGIWKVILRYFNDVKKYLFIFLPHKFETNYFGKEFFCTPFTPPKFYHDNSCLLKEIIPTFVILVCGY